jgi:hypothetical protein
MLPASPKLQQSSPVLVSHWVSLVQDLEHESWQTPRSESPDEPASPSSSDESFSAQPLNTEKQSASEPAALKNLSIIEVITLSPEHDCGNHAPQPTQVHAHPTQSAAIFTQAFSGV